MGELSIARPDRSLRLSESTKALYGLGQSAGVEEILAFLGKYNQHWWRRRVYIKSGGYAEAQTATTGVRYLYYDTDNIREFEIRYAPSVSIDQTTGQVALLAPKTMSVGDKVSEEVIKEKLSGRYVSGLLTSTTGAQTADIYYIPETAKFTKKSSSHDEEYYISFIKGGINKVSSQIYDDSVIGDWTYIQAPSHDIYPESGIVGGYEYQYLGVPLDNAVNALQK